ncbi:MAG: hypothetical protein ACR2PM_00375 [Hyphomicrobiales bacterium]
MRTSPRKHETWFEDLRDEFNSALPAIIADRWDRTGLMRSLPRAQGEPISVRLIVSAVANTGDMPFMDIVGNSVRGEVSTARALVVHLVTELRPDLNNEQIARAMSRERSIVYLARKRAAGLLETSSDFMHWYVRARKHLGLAACAN